MTSVCSLPSNVGAEGQEGMVIVEITSGETLLIDTTNSTMQVQSEMGAPGDWGVALTEEVTIAGKSVSLLSLGQLVVPVDATLRGYGDKPLVIVVAAAVAVLGGFAFITTMISQGRKASTLCHPHPSLKTGIGVLLAHERSRSVSLSLAPLKPWPNVA